MKVKVSEATGPVLDWMVAEALKPSVNTPERFGIATFGPLFGKGYLYPCFGTRKYSPSTDWNEGGPIIERERICADWLGSEWSAKSWARLDGKVLHQTGYAYGPTPLIAAMRCFVTSKLGDEVDVPEELLS